MGEMVDVVQAEQGTRRHRFEWFNTGRELLEAKLAAIEGATKFIRMETYIYTDEEIGRWFRQALIDAGRRGVKVKLLVDAIGGMDLDEDYFKELDDMEGCMMRWFNRPSLSTWSFRDHRKLLVIDGSITFVGGCNIGEHYHGDGVTYGWRDGGVRVDGPVARTMAAGFELQWKRAEMIQWKEQAKKAVKGGRAPERYEEVKPLFIQPGFGQSPLRDAFRVDLKAAKEVCITSAYFLPSLGLRRQLGAAAARGTRIRLLLGGRSDVKLMQLATRSLYKQLLDARMEVWEYQPQILHSKVLILDDIVYVGSSNLDPRSLRINFEVMLRIRDAALAETARAAFEGDLARSVRVTHESAWKEGWWARLKQRCAHWVLARVDPRMSEGMLRRLEFRA